MSKHCLPFVALALVVALAAFVAPPPARLAIGDAAPMTDTEMLDISGEMFSLEDVMGENGLLVVFSCNTCPWVEAWQDRYPVLMARAETLGIGMILVNSNEAYRDQGDGLEDMQAFAAANGYTVPYVIDENHALADAFGATRTPDVFLFDPAFMLAYLGAIDDNARNADAVERPFLLDAMENLAAGETIDPTETKSVGCTIKRLS